MRRNAIFCMLSIVLVIPCFEKSLLAQRERQLTTDMQNAERVCSVQCLYFVSQYSDIDVTYQELLDLLKPTSVGVSMLTLKEVAQGVGFEVKAAEVRIQDIATLPDTMIAYDKPQESKGDVGTSGFSFPCRRRSDTGFSTRREEKTSSQKRMCPRALVTCPYLFSGLAWPVLAPRTRSDSMQAYPSWIRELTPASA